MAGFSLVTSTAGVKTTASSASLSITPTAAGQLIVAYVINGNNANMAAPTATGLTFTQLGTSSQGTACASAIYGAISTGSSAVSVSVTLTSSGTTGGMSLEVWSGGPSTIGGVLDTVGTTHAASGTTTSTNGATGSTACNDLWLTVLATGGTITGQSATTFGIWTQGPNGAINTGGSAYYIGTTQSSFYPDWTWTTSRANAAVIVCLFAGTVTPTVSSISPTSGSVGGSTTVTVTGTGFTGATTTHVGTTACLVTPISDTSCSLVTPAGTGVQDITVTNSSGTSSTGAGDQFTYTGGTNNGAGFLGLF